MAGGCDYGHAGSRKITLTAEDVEYSQEMRPLPSPVTPEQKLRRYLSLKLSADFHDLLTMSASSPIFDTVIQNKQTHGCKLRVFSLFSAQRSRGVTDAKDAYHARKQENPQGVAQLGSVRGDFICLPDFGEHTRAGQLRDADSLLDSLFS